MYPALEKQFELRLHPADEGMLRRIGTNSHVSLNAVAVEIFEMCNGKTSFETICQILAKRHNDTSDRVKEITMKFLQKAKERKYVVFCETPINNHVLIVGSREFFPPSYAGIELTYRCNLKCKHCYADASASSKIKLSTSDALTILEKLHKAGVASVMFTGGEPTLHPDLFKLLEFSSKKFEQLLLLSNGWEINETFAKKIATYKHKLVIQISLDGKNSDTHDYIRGRKGSFKRACNAINILSKNRVPVIVAMLVTKFNLDQIEDTFLLVKSLGAFGFRIGRTTPLGRAEEVDWELTNEEFMDAGKTLNILFKKYSKEVYVESWEDIITGKHPKISENENKKEFGNNCGAGHRLINVTPNGDVTPCSTLSEKKFYLGNILKQDLKTVLGSSMNRFFYRINTPSVKSCGNCKYFYSCMGCVFRGYSMHKKISECPWAKQEITDDLNKRELKYN